MLGLREVSEEQEQLILKDLNDAVELHAPFFVLMASSTVIATFGLLLNSPAIIIGAMLVAPLMTPIFSLSVALIRGRNYMMRRALLVEFYGVVIAILVAVLIGLMMPEPELTYEIQARMHPTLLDLAVALAAGLAGSFSLAREEVSPALPGVAIAVALLPPLAVVGLGVSMRRWDVAGGALVLFLANFVAIHLVSAAVFYLSGLAHHIVERNPKILIKNFGAALVILIVMFGFLGVQLSQLVSGERASRVARSTIDQQVKMVAGAQLSELDVNCREDPCRVVATVETPKVFEPPLVGGIQNVLASQLGREVELVIRSVALSEASAEGYHFVSASEEKTTVEQATPVAVVTPQQKIQALLAQQAMMVPGAALMNFQYTAGQEGEAPKVVATYLTQAPFGEALEVGIANLLRNQMGAEIVLEVKYVAPLPTEPPEEEKTPNRQ